MNPSQRQYDNELAVVDIFEQSRPLHALFSRQLDYDPLIEWTNP
jgi:hypothetical protein